MSRLLLIGVLLSACTAADRYRAHVPPPGPALTVLVPGYRGSFLYDGDDRFYLNPTDAFSDGDDPLGSCAGGRKPLQAGGPMTTFTIWPYRFEVYGGFMTWAEAHLPGFTAFGYDWRVSALDTADQLCAFIGDRQANLVAHSMGGLVTMLALQKCPEHIGSVVFAGVPFRGAPGVLKDLFLGSPTNKNTALLSPEALWTFSATWQLMPRTDDFFIDDADQPVTVPISDPATWAKWKLPCPDRLAERLKDRAAVPVEFAQTPRRALTVIGRGISTTQRLRVSGDFFDFERPQRSDGDGAVLASNAAAPFDAEKVFTTAEHTNLLDDPKVREAIEAFLR